MKQQKQPTIRLLRGMVEVRKGVDARPVLVASRLYIRIHFDGDGSVVCYRKHSDYDCKKLVSSYEKEWYEIPMEIREVAFVLAEGWQGSYRELLESAYSLGPEPEAA